MNATSSFPRSAWERTARPLCGHAVNHADAERPSHAFPRGAWERGPSPAGFTLIELLTVIVIIGILVGLVVGAYFPVKNAVTNANMKTEVSQLSLALENCRTQIGLADYPADITDVYDFQRCVQRAFPRARYTCSGQGTADWLIWLKNNSLITTAPSSGANFTDVDKAADRAIVFWLGGVWNPNEGRFIGFSADPTDPLDIISLANGKGYCASRIGPFFDFDKTRLQFVNNIPTYRFFPKNNRTASMSAAVSSTNRPLLYFKAQGGAYARTAGAVWTALWREPDKDADGGTMMPATSGALVRPFFSATAGGGWVNNTSYQLLCPGLDGAFVDQSSKRQTSDGTSPPLYPVGGNYTTAVFDDITNFVQGAKIESDMP